MSILVVAPHPDDEVLGVGGTIIKKTRSGERVIVCVATKDKDYEVRRKEADEAYAFMGVDDVAFLNFPDLQLDKIPHEQLTDALREVMERYEPREVYMPHPGDLHTDHKALTASVLVAIRPKYSYAPEFAYTYETLSETGLDYQNPLNSFSPNVYEDITNTIQDKLKALSLYESQIEEYPCCRSDKAIEALGMYRGTQAGMHSAEAFSLMRWYKR